MRTPPYVGRGIERSFSEPATLIRAGEGGRNEVGEWVPGVDEETDVRATVAPVTAEDAAETREVLPEGARLSDARRFWLRQPVEAIRAGTTDGDCLRYAGTEYRVLQVMDWSRGGFVEALAVREQGI